MRIWEAMILAKGGRERLYKIQTMVQEDNTYTRFANPKFPNGNIHFVRAFAFPNFEWDWVDSGKTIFGSHVITADLTAGLGYIGFPDGETRQSSALGRERGFLRSAQLVYLNETRWLQPKPVRVLTGKDISRGVDAIETILSGARVDFWISRADHLPVKIIDYIYNKYTKVLEPGYTYDFADYQEIQGIRIPGLVTTTLTVGPPHKIRENTILNPKLRDDLFTTPPRFADGPDAWKAP